MIAETDRLILREFEPTDANALFLLNQDEKVIQYTGDESFVDKKEAKEFIKNYTHYSEFGFGRWAVILKENNAFIGWCGLKYTPQFDEYDVGFRFFRNDWNKGYATEAARKCVELGFSKYGMDKIVGRAVKKNSASVKVLKNIGMTCVADMDFHGMKGAKFEIKSLK